VTGEIGRTCWRHTSQRSTSSLTVRVRWSITKLLLLESSELGVWRAARDSNPNRQIRRLVLSVHTVRLNAVVLAGGLTPGLTRIKPRRGGGSHRGIRSGRSGPAQVADDCLVIGGVEASYGCAGERGRLHDDPLPQLSRPEEDVVDALVDQLFGLDGAKGCAEGRVTAVGRRRRRTMRR
jgi:hypothetical protein